MTQHIKITLKENGNKFILHGTVTSFQGNTNRIVIDSTHRIRYKKYFRRIVLHSGPELKDVHEAIIRFVNNKFGPNINVKIEFIHISSHQRVELRRRNAWLRRKGRKYNYKANIVRPKPIPLTIGSSVSNFGINLAPHFPIGSKLIIGVTNFMLFQLNRSEQKEINEVVQVKVFYATDRQQLKSLDGKISYTANRNNKLSYGDCIVTLPIDRKPGELPRPTFLGIQYRPENAKKDIVIASLSEKSEVDFFREIKSLPENSALLFIHGYNNDFNAAIYRTGQLKYDLNFTGPTFCYSWPSSGSLLDYIADDNTIQATEFYLKEFINKLIKNTDITTLCIIAHSMGNRAITSVLKEMSNTQSFPIIIKQLILAAPDIDRDIFVNQIVPAIRGKTSITLYASAIDRALWFSEFFRKKYPRAGDAGDSIVVVDGVETIDASKIPDGFLSHSYFSNVKSVIDDIFQIVRHNHSADQRNLLVKTKDGMQYWELP